MYRSIRRKRYENLVWKGLNKEYKVKRWGARFVAVHVPSSGFSTVFAPLTGLSNKQLVKLVPRGHMRVPRHMMKTLARRSR